MASELPILDSSSRRAPDFDETLRRHGTPELRAGEVTTLQINVGKLCNQACHHCHVDAGPRRTEVMTLEVAERLLALLAASSGIEVVDITGGAPELNRNFRRLVLEARDSGRRVIDRCNLTILFEPGQEDLGEFLAGNGVEVVASLPCYTADNVDAQRGRGVFEKSIEGLRALNRLGYAQPGTGLSLDLVYNPGGPFLPPAQKQLEVDYRLRLHDDFGVRFDRLLTLTNMPISRFADQLEREGRLSDYLSLLVSHFNPATVDGLMCRSQLSVGWDGRLYDCDFNQMLEMEIDAGRASSPTVFEIDSFDELANRPIVTAPHCFGCTAGAGSSCGGSLD